MRISFQNVSFGGTSLFTIMFDSDVTVMCRYSARHVSENDSKKLLVPSKIQTATIDSV